MNIIKASLVLFAAALVAAGADVSGKWIGNTDVKLPDGEARTYSIELQLTQKGDTVSGAIGTGEGDGFAIQNAKFQGSRLSFEVTPPDASTPVKFELDLNGDRLEGHLKGEAEGGPITGKVTLARAK